MSSTSQTFGKACASKKPLQKTGYIFRNRLIQHWKHFDGKLKCLYAQPCSDLGMYYHSDPSATLWDEYFAISDSYRIMTDNRLLWMTPSRQIWIYTRTFWLLRHITKDWRLPRYILELQAIYLTTQSLMFDGVIRPLGCIPRIWNTLLFFFFSFHFASVTFTGRTTGSCR